MRPTNQQETTLSNSKNPYKTEKRIDLLFSKFAAFYGHVWRTQFKEDVFLKFAKKEWQEGLSCFSDEIFDQAVVACRDHCELPPTLPQLIQMCRDIKKRSAFTVVVANSIKPDPVMVKTQLTQCKAILAAQNKENNAC